ASSTASGTAASAGGGGGLSNLAIAGIVAGAGAGIGGALIASKASSESDSDKCRASAACGQWDVLFTSPGLNVSACSTAVVGGFCCQGFNIDLSGAFHEVWSSSTPVVQVDGTLTPTGLTGVLRCLSTPAS